MTFSYLVEIAPICDHRDHLTLPAIALVFASLAQAQAAFAQAPATEKELRYLIGIAPRDKLDRARNDLQRIIKGAVDDFKYRDVDLSEKAANGNIARTFRASDPDPNGRIRETSVTVSTNNDGACGIRYVGGFGPNSTNAFLDAAKYANKSGCAKVLVGLKSPGGKIQEGIRIGTVIRYMQWDTVAIHGCISACSFAYLGGVNRFKPATGDKATNGGLIMVHQPREVTGACVTDPHQRTNLFTFAYLYNLIPSAAYGLMAKLLSRDCVENGIPVEESDTFFRGIYNQTYTLSVQNQFGLDAVEPTNPK